MDSKKTTLAQQAPNKIDSKRTTLRHIIIKISKVKDSLFSKERILKTAREKQIVTCKGVPITLAVVFSKLCRLEGTDKKHSK